MRAKKKPLWFRIMNRPALAIGRLDGEGVAKMMLIVLALFNGVVGTALVFIDLTHIPWWAITLGYLAVDGLVVLNFAFGVRAGAIDMAAMYDRKETMLINYAEKSMKCLKCGVTGSYKLCKDDED